ncbi:MAG: hypothetical protein EBU85_08285 [Actinobacteria bacterium]|nr:hypothetical protein [Actinomycetota bacterium]
MIVRLVTEASAASQSRARWMRATAWSKPTPMVAARSLICTHANNMLLLLEAHERVHMRTLLRAALAARSNTNGTDSNPCTIGTMGEDGG